MQEILVGRCELVLELSLHMLDDLWIALHGASRELGAIIVAQSATDCGRRRADAIAIVLA